MILSLWHSLKCYFSANEFQIFSLAQASLTDFRLTYPTACPTIPLGFLADNSDLTCLKLRRLPEVCSVHSVLHLGGCQLPAFYGSDQKSWIAFDSPPPMVYLLQIMVSLTSKYTEILTKYGMKLQFHPCPSSSSWNHFPPRLQQWPSNLDLRFSREDAPAWSRNSVVLVSIMIFAPDSWGLPHIQGALKPLMEGHLHAMFRLECSLEDPHPEKAEKGRTGVLGLKELLSFYNDQSH